MESMKKAQEIAKQAEVVNKELMETKVTGKDPSGQVGLVASRPHSRVSLIWIHLTLHAKTPSTPFRWRARSRRHSTG